MGNDDEPSTHRGTEVKIDAKLLAKEVSSLAVATDVRPPLFSGKAGDDVAAWVRRFETVSTALEWDRVRQLAQVGVYLTLFAASWYSKKTKDGAEPYTSWAIFKKDIIDRFQADDFRAQLKRRLTLRKLGRDEAVEDYYNDVLALCDQFDRDMEDTDIIERLMNGLYPDLMARVCLSPAKTPMAFLSDVQKALVAMRKEQNFRGDRGPFNGPAGNFGRHSAGTSNWNGGYRNENFRPSNSGRGGAPGSGHGGGHTGFNQPSNGFGHASGAAVGPPRDGATGRNGGNTPGGGLPGSIYGGGGGGGGGPAAQRGNLTNQARNKMPGNRAPITCYGCGGPHIQRNCPENGQQAGRGGQVGPQQLRTIRIVATEHPSQPGNGPGAVKASDSTGALTTPMGWRSGDFAALMHEASLSREDRFADISVAPAEEATASSNDLRATVEEALANLTDVQAMPWGTTDSPLRGQNADREVEIDEETGEIWYVKSAPKTTERSPTGHRKVTDVDSRVRVDYSPASPLTPEARGLKRTVIDVITVDDNEPPVVARTTTTVAPLAQPTTTTSVDKDVARWRSNLISQVVDSTDKTTDARRNSKAHLQCHTSSVVVEDDTERTEPFTVHFRQESEGGATTIVRKTFEGVPPSVERFNMVICEESAPIAASPTDGATMEFGTVGLSRPCPVIQVRLNKRDATALIDTGASFSIINFSFVKGLGLKLTPHVMEAELADNRIIKTVGRIELEVELHGLTGRVPFCILEDVGSKHDAVLGCNVLAIPGLLLDAAAGRLFLNPAVTLTPDETVPPDLVGDREAIQGPILAYRMGILRQQTGGGPIKRHKMSLLSIEGGGLDEDEESDMSKWDYSWNEVPVESFDMCDAETTQHRDLMLSLLRKYSNTFHTEGKRMGGAKVQPFRIQLVPDARPVYQNQYRRPLKEREEIEARDKTCWTRE